MQAVQWNSLHNSRTNEHGTTNAYANQKRFHTHTLNELQRNCNCKLKFKTTETTTTKKKNIYHRLNYLSTYILLQFKTNKQNLLSTMVYK